MEYFLEAYENTFKRKFFFEKITKFLKMGKSGKFDTGPTTEQTQPTYRTGRIWTHTFKSADRMLSQLSYSPIWQSAKFSSVYIVSLPNVSFG